jgi:hypothetical protein
MHLKAECSVMHTHAAKHLYNSLFINAVEFPNTHALLLSNSQISSYIIPTILYAVNLRMLFTNRGFPAILWEISKCAYDNIHVSRSWGGVLVPGLLELLLWFLCLPFTTVFQLRECWMSLIFIKVLNKFLIYVLWCRCVWWRLMYLFVPASVADNRRPRFALPPSACHFEWRVLASATPWS